jgi:hypothetical protein
MVSLCTICGEYPQSKRKGVKPGQCCNKCPDHGPWCTKHELVSPESQKNEKQKKEKRLKAGLSKAALKEKSGEAFKGRPLRGRPLKGFLKKREKSGEALKGTKCFKRRAPAPAPARSIKKRSATVASQRCEHVVAAISSVERLPASCKDMLISMARSSLTVFAVERHCFQTKAVEILKESLTGIESDMLAAVERAQSDMNCEDPPHAVATEHSQVSFAELKDKVASAKESVKLDKSNLTSAKDKLSSAVAALEAKERDIASLREAKSALETMLREVYETLKTYGCKAKGVDGRKAIGALVKIFSENGLEAGLVDSLPETLRKDPKERGTFDHLVEKHVETQAENRIARTESDIQDAETCLADLITEKAFAEEAVKAAKEKLDASTSSLHAVSAAVKDSEQALKSVALSLTLHEQKMAIARKGLEDAETKLTQFRQGALQVFTELEHLANEQVEFIDEI